MNTTTLFEYFDQNEIEKTLLELFDIKNRIIVVTGGAGKLGRCYVQFLLKLGAKVAIFDLENANGVLKNDTRNLLVLNVDVTKKDEILKGLEKVEYHFNDLPYGLINNAAIDSEPSQSAKLCGMVEDLSEEYWDHVIDVNVKGVFLCTQIVGARMVKKGKGRIINIGSIYGQVSPDQSIYQFRRDRGENYYKPLPYSVSKSALLNMTRYFSTYWAKTNITVNTLTLAGVFANQESEFIERYITRIPIGRMANSKDYVGALLYLLSDASAYMTGANMIIDGGWTAI